jgi:phage FluMu protein Com
MKCPVCGSLNFFVKDPDDEYETFEFELKDAVIVYNSEAGN